jgi:hypothetical protein
VPGVEFLDDDADDPREPPLPRPRRGFGVARGLGIGVALAAAVGIVVVIRSGGGGTPAAAPSPAQLTFPHPPPATRTLSLPVSVAFGAASVDVLAFGSRIYSLTPTLIGVADRDSTAVTVRAAPLGMSELAGHGTLQADLAHHLLWAVDIGGNAIAAYDSDHLDTLTSVVSPFSINGAVAMDEQLWFTTDHGLYTVTAGPGAPHRVTHMALGPIVADRTLHRVVAADRHNPAGLHAITSYGPVAAMRLPVGDVSSMAYPAGAMWVVGATAAGRQLVVVDAPKLVVRRTSSVGTLLGDRGAIVATFENRLLARGGPSGRTLFCIDGYSGTIKERWTVPPGAVALNERGLLVDSSRGIEEINAQDCLAA